MALNHFTYAELIREIVAEQLRRQASAVWMGANDGVWAAELAPTPCNFESQYVTMHWNVSRGIWNFSSLLPKEKLVGWEADLDGPPVWAMPGWRGPVKVCECGAKHIKDALHALWCPSFEELY